MVRQVVWSPGALEDPAEIRAYLEQQSSVSAERVVNRIADTAETLSDFPSRGRIIPEFGDPNRRETFVHRWRVMYRVEQQQVRIIRVIHGSRLLKYVPGSFEESAQDEYALS